MRCYRAAIAEHCPEGFGGMLEHDWATDRLKFRLKSDGIDGVVTKSLDDERLREIIGLGFPLDVYPFAEEVIAARDHLMEHTLP
jgi:hypothetical protein